MIQLNKNSQYKFKKQYDKLICHITWFYKCSNECIKELVEFITSLHQILIQNKMHTIATYKLYNKTNASKYDTFMHLSS